MLVCRDGLHYVAKSSEVPLHVQPGHTDQRVFLARLTESLQVLFIGSDRLGSAVGDAPAEQKRLNGLAEGVSMGFLTEIR
jgi:hypothetical protein